MCHHSNQSNYAMLSFRVFSSYLLLVSPRHTLCIIRKYYLATPMVFSENSPMLSIIPVLLLAA